MSEQEKPNRITRAEALRISQETLEQAELERCEQPTTFEEWLSRVEFMKELTTGAVLRECWHASRAALLAELLPSVEELVKAARESTDYIGRDRVESLRAVAILKMALSAVESAIEKARKP